MAANKKVWEQSVKQLIVSSRVLQTDPAKFNSVAEEYMLFLEQSTHLPIADQTERMRALRPLQVVWGRLARHATCAEHFYCLAQMVERLKNFASLTQSGLSANDYYIKAANLKHPSSLCKVAQEIFSGSLSFTEYPTKNNPWYGFRWALDTLYGLQRDGVDDKDISLLTNAVSSLGGIRSIDLINLQGSIPKPGSIQYNQILTALAERHKFDPCADKSNTSQQIPFLTSKEEKAKLEQVMPLSVCLDRFQELSDSESDIEFKVVLSGLIDNMEKYLSMETTRLEINNQTTELVKSIIDLLDSSCDPNRAALRFTEAIKPFNQKTTAGWFESGQLAMKLLLNIMTYGMVIFRSKGNDDEKKSADYLYFSIKNKWSQLMSGNNGIAYGISQISARFFPSSGDAGRQPVATPIVTVPGATY